METLKKKATFRGLIILALLATSCVPDSLTKFKEDATAPTGAPSTVITPPTTIIIDGAEVDADDVKVPSSAFYDDTQPYVFITGDSSLANNDTGKNVVTVIEPGGVYENYVRKNPTGTTYIGATPEDETKATFLDPISNPGFYFSTDMTTTYSSQFATDNQTGDIVLQGTNVPPLREITVTPFPFNFYNPGSASANFIAITNTPTISVQAPIPEDITFETDTSFNCTSTQHGSILTAAPSPVSVGDTYLSGGVCYYDYDGAITAGRDEVGYPYSGTVYIGFKLDTNDGFFATDAIISENFETSRGARGVITYKDDSGNIYGQITSGQVYPGDEIDNAIPFSNVEGTITKLKYFFEPTQNINLRLVNDTDTLHTSYSNTTKISISPNLPTTLRLVKDVDSPLFGYIIDISGSSDHLYSPVTEYEVTVENDISKRVINIDLGIINTPDRLSYSQLVGFKVKSLTQSSTRFDVGQEVATSITPPLTQGGKGIIRKIIDIDGNEKYLIVQVNSGVFVEDESIDNYGEFLDEEAVIQTTPTSLTHVIAFDPLEATAPAVDYCVDDSSGAVGIINAIATTSTNQYAFINQSFGTGSTNFSTGSTVVSYDTNCDGVVDVPAIDIIEFWSPIYKATYSNATNLVSGMDLLTTTNRANLVVSEIDTATNTSLLQSSDGQSIIQAWKANTNYTSGDIILYNGGTYQKTITGLSGAAFTAGNWSIATRADRYSMIRPYSAAAEEIDSYESTLVFQLQRGKDSYIEASLNRGEDITYKVSPPLPTGLSLDEKTGIISGQAEVASAAKTYTIQAINILGTVETTFQILIEDFFEIEVEIANTPQFYLHKAGEDNLYNKCRIKKKDILSNPKGSSADTDDIIDVDCYLDMGENDLYTKSINIKPTVGPGICHSIQYVPFSFWKSRPIKTNISLSAGSDYLVHQVSGGGAVCGEAFGVSACTAGGCTSSGSTSSFTNSKGLTVNSSTYSASADGLFVNGAAFDGSLEDLCQSKYAQVNCDNGTIQYELVSYDEEVIEDDADTTPADESRNNCEVSSTVETYSCAGIPTACLEGPAVDKLGTTFISEQTSTFAGAQLSYSLASPISKGLKTNRFNANFTNTMSCSNDTVHATGGLEEHSAVAGSIFSLDVSEVIDPFRGTSPNYVFNCLDEFSDLQARIRLNIRDWDTGFSNDWDIAEDIGNDWGLDNSLTDAFSNAYNSRYDWDDYNAGTNYSACNETTAPTVDTNNFGAATTLSVAASKNDTSLVVTGGFFFRHGMEIEIGGDRYKVRAVDGNEVFITSPLLAAHAAASPITINYLHVFPDEDL